MDERNNVKSDAEWYFLHDENTERYYGIFFKICRKYGISWASASDKERAFVEEVTRLTYEHDKAKRLGLPTSAIKPSFGLDLTA